MNARQLGLCFWLLLAFSQSWAQRPVVDLYQVKVTTQTGERLSGILNEVTETTLYIRFDEEAPAFYEKVSGGIPLSVVKKVIVKRLHKRGAGWPGAVVGGLLGFYATNQSLQRAQPRSPVTYGVSLTLGIGVGVGLGAFVGNLISNMSRRVIRPRDKDDPARSLYRELLPFSYQYQIKLINRLPQ